MHAVEELKTKCTYQLMCVLGKILNRDTLYFCQSLRVETNALVTRICCCEIIWQTHTLIDFLISFLCVLTKKNTIQHATLSSLDIFFTHFPKKFKLDSLVFKLMHAIIIAFQMSISTLLYPYKDLRLQKLLMAFTLWMITSEIILYL